MESVLVAQGGATAITLDDKPQIRTEYGFEKAHIIVYRFDNDSFFKPWSVHVYAAFSDKNKLLLLDKCRVDYIPVSPMQSPEKFSILQWTGCHGALDGEFKSLLKENFPNGTTLSEIDRALLTSQDLQGHISDKTSSSSYLKSYTKKTESFLVKCKIQIVGRFDKEDRLQEPLKMSSRCVGP